MTKQIELLVRINVTVPTDFDASSAVIDVYKKNIRILDGDCVAVAGAVVNEYETMNAYDA